MSSLLARSVYMNIGAVISHSERLNSSLEGQKLRAADPG